MKTQQNSQNAHHIANTTRKTFTRIILQIFVWALIIAFISTLGVMWDSNGMGFPTIIKSSKGTVDLSPRSLYYVELNRLSDEISSNNQNVDPRVFNRYVQQAALSNTADLFTRQLFYHSINLKPSPKVHQELITTTGLNSNLVDFQYAESYYNSPLGILSIVSTPTVSDMYAITDLRELSIVAEMIILNKTNFLISQVNPEELETYYQANFEKWLNQLTFHEFSAENRRKAREIIANIKEQGIENITNTLSKDIAFKSSINLVANATNFSYFNSILTSYKSNISSPIPIIAGPLDAQGRYNVAVIEKLPSITNLPPTIQREVTISYINENYKKLSTQSETKWKEQLVALKSNITNTSFSALLDKVQGSINHNTQPFTLGQRYVTNVLGQIINIPLLQNKDILHGLLNTSLGTPTSIISPTKEVYLSIRPILRQYNSEKKTDVNDPIVLQGIYQYKATLLRDSLNSKQMKKKYNVKVDYNQLTNIN